MVRLLDCDETSRYLMVDLDTLRKIIRTGELEAYKVGRQIRIAETAIESYLQTVKLKPQG